MKKMTTILTNETDEITAGFPIGMPEVVASALKPIRANQHELVNTMGDKVTSTDVDLTLTDNNTGATMNITADKVTTGVETTQAQWSALSTPKALKIALHMAGAMAPHIQNAIHDALQACADGADWETAVEEVLGHRLTTEQTDRVDSMIDDTRREVVRTRNGRMQATGVSTN